MATNVATRSKRARTAKPVGGGNTIFGFMPINRNWTANEIAVIERACLRVVSVLKKLQNYDASLTHSGR